MKIAALYFGYLSVSLWAQGNFASLRGNLEDPQGRAVSNARVQLKSTATGTVRKAQVGQSGVYDFANLSPDEYELEVQAAGFATLTRSLRLEVGQATTLD